MVSLGSRRSRFLHVSDLETLLFAVALQSPLKSAMKKPETPRSPIGSGFSVSHDPAEAERLHDEAKRCTQLYKASGLRKELNKAIEFLEKAAELADPNGTMLGNILNGLCISLHSRYEKVPRLNDLTSGIEYGERCVRLTRERDNTPEKLSRRLAALGRLYHKKYSDASSAEEDFEKATGLYEESAGLDEADDRHVAIQMHNIAIAYLSKYQKRPNREVLATAITWLEKSLKRLPPADLGKKTKYTWVLVDLLEERAEVTDDKSLLRTAIELLAGIIEISSSEEGAEVDSPKFQARMSTIYVKLFEKTMDLNELRKAVNHAQRAAEDTPNDHPMQDERVKLFHATLRRLQRMSGTVPHDDSEIAEHERRMALLAIDAKLEDQASDLERQALARYERYTAVHLINDLMAARDIMAKSAESTYTASSGDDLIRRLHYLTLFCYQLYRENNNEPEYIEEGLIAARQAVEIIEAGAKSSIPDSLHAACRYQLAQLLGLAFEGINPNDRGNTCDTELIEEAISHANAAVNISFRLEDIDRDASENLRLYQKSLERLEMLQRKQPV